MVPQKTRKPVVAKTSTSTASKTLAPAALAKKLAGIEAAKKLESTACAKKSVAAPRRKKSVPAPKPETLNQVEVVFTYSTENPEPRNVFVAGDFNGWDPQAHALQWFDGGLYRAVLRLAPGMHQYKFVVNGEWTHDPRAESHIDNGHGTLNSVVHV